MTATRSERGGPRVAPATDPQRTEPAGGEEPRSDAAAGGPDPGARGRLRSDLAALRIDRDGEGDTAVAPHRRRGIVAALAVGLAVALWIGYRATAARTPVVQVATVVAHPAGEPVRGPVLAGSGYVITGEKYISIGARVPGRIVRYHVDEGQSVAAGDPLVALDDRDYRARLERAQALLARARADLALHTTELRRARELRAAGVVATQEVDEARNRVAVDRAAIAQFEAEVAQARVELEYTVLRAPRDGVVLAKLKEVGEIAVPGGFAGSGDLIRMANLEDLRAEVDVNETDLRRVALGQAAEVVPDAYPDRRYDARVVKLYPQVNRQKGTLKVEVQLVAPDERLLPDMSVRVNFLAEATPATAAASVVTVPRAALQRDAQGPHVWVVREGRVSRRAVTVGAELGEETAITAGLAGGESVVVGDTTALAEGSEVRSAPASGSRSGD